MSNGFRIGPYAVGDGAPLLVVAEIGLNHDGDAARAVALVDAAGTAGASAVKLQTLRAGTLVAPDCPAPMHVRASSLAEFFSRFELDEAAHRQVATAARARGLAFVSTPFDEAAVEMLVRLDVDALKIASGDLTHHRLIATAAATGRPLILSTGMSSLDEVAAAVACAREAGAVHFALLHCVSCYPTPPRDANLAVIATLAREFRVPVGLSDHGVDPLAVGLAVALGASLYERHVVAHADDPAIDRAVSSTPAELADAVSLARRARLLIGQAARVCGTAEAGNRPASRRAMHAARDLPAGTPIVDADLLMLRPLRGIGAERWRDVIGARLATDVHAGDVLTPRHLGWPEEPPSS